MSKLKEYKLYQHPFSLKNKFNNLCFTINNLSEINNETKNDLTDIIDDLVEEYGDEIYDLEQEKDELEDEVSELEDEVSELKDELRGVLTNDSINRLGSLEAFNRSVDKFGDIKVEEFLNKLYKYGSLEL